MTIEQDAIDPKLLQGFIRFTEGQPFSGERIRSTQFALEDSYYFSSVTVTPGERDPATLTVPVTIRADRIKRDRYSVSVGFGTDTGPRGQFTWDRRLVNDSRPPLVASRRRSRACCRRRSHATSSRSATRRIEKLEFSAGYINEELGDLDSERYELAAGLTQVDGTSGSACCS